MSTAPEAQTEGAAVHASHSGLMHRSCWGCRLISGGGLILAGGYVFMAARNMMRRGGPPSIGAVMQITFAASLAAWGIVIIADPTAKNTEKDARTQST